MCKLLPQSDLFPGLPYAWKQGLARLHWGQGEGKAYGLWIPEAPGERMAGHPYYRALDTATVT